MYLLQNNVELVKGAKNYCIYDLNTGKLYHLDSEYVQYLEAILDESIVDHAVPISALEYFLNAGIVVTANNLVEKIPEYVYEGKIDFAWIEITRRCNIFCRHCYEYSPSHCETTQMSMDDYRIVIDSLRNYNVSRVQLVGGEPLIHPNIEEMICYASGKFEYVEIFTNGTTLSDSMLDCIDKNNIALAFSVYADNAPKHDYITRSDGSYYLTIESIKKAVAKGVKVRLSSIETKETPRFQFLEIKCEHRSDLPRLTGRADLSLYNRDMLLRKLITKDSFQTPIDSRDYYKNKQIHNCFGEKLYIGSNLDVYPCSMERRVSYGNLHTNSIVDIVNKSFAKLNKDTILGCKDCEFRYACFDCRPDSNNASFQSKPWYCTYNPFDGIWNDQDEFVDTLLSDHNL